MRSGPCLAWTPLLEGASAARAHQAIEEVRAALAPEARAPHLHPEGTGAASGAALLSGYAALSRSPGGPLRDAEAHLTGVSQMAGSVPLGPALYGGFSGLAWTVEHLHGLAGSEEDVVEEVDALLLAHVGRAPWRGPFDLVSGLVGLGVYALERGARPGARALLGAVVERLAELAQPQPGGMAWWTPPELLPQWQRAQCPGGYHNLGVAHGVPGIIALLAQAAAVGVAPSRAAALTRGAVAWLRTQREPKNAPAAFPSWRSVGGEASPSRDTWCYGAPGIALALRVAAQALGERAWEQEALELAREVARKEPEQLDIPDAGLCHGTAGLGHMFNRLFQATGEPLFREAAVTWLLRTLALYRPGEGCGGFFQLQFDEQSRTRQWVPSPDFLSGSAGIALALLAAVSPVEPGWDRLLLLSAAPRASEALS